MQETHPLVGLLLSRQLKKLGFNEPCFNYYTEEGNSEFGQGHAYDYNDERNYVDLISRPDIFQVGKWLRERKLIHVSVHSPITANSYWYVKIGKVHVNFSMSMRDGYLSHDSAYLGGLEMAIEHLISDKQ